MLDKIQFVYTGNQEAELRLVFDNDRRHAAAVKYPFGAEQVATALMILARNITNDPHLKG